MANHTTGAQRRNARQNKIWETAKALKREHDAPGQLAYEQDCTNRPLYHDGTKRPSWDQLSEIAKWSWNRTPIRASKDDYDEDQDEQCIALGLMRRV